MPASVSSRGNQLYVDDAITASWQNGIHTLQMCDNDKVLKYLSLHNTVNKKIKDMQWYLAKCNVKKMITETEREYNERVKEYVKQWRKYKEFQGGSIALGKDNALNYMIKTSKDSIWIDGVEMLYPSSWLRSWRDSGIELAHEKYVERIEYAKKIYGDYTQKELIALHQLKNIKQIQQNELTHFANYGKMHL